MLQGQNPGLQPGRGQASVLFVPTMIWISLLFSIGTLWFLATLNMQAPAEGAAPTEVPVSIFAIVAAVVGAMSFFVPNFLVETSIKQGRPGNLAEAALGIFFVSFLIKLSLREAIAVLGFLLVSMGGPMIYFTYFGSAAAVLILIAKPTAEQIKEIEHRLRMKAGTPASP